MIFSGVYSADLQKVLGSPLALMEAEGTQKRVEQSRGAEVWCLPAGTAPAPALKAALQPPQVACSEGSFFL